VTEGYDRWQRFDERFGEQQQRIRQLDPGEATWEDLAAFAEEHLAAVPVDGFTGLSFAWVEGEVRESSYDARVLSLRGQGSFACGDYGGIPVTNATGQRADQMGLNITPVAETLRRLAFPTEATGAAYVGWPEDAAWPFGSDTRPLAVLAVVRQTVRQNPGSLTEVATSLHLLVVPSAGKPRLIEGADKANVIRTLQRATIRRDPVPDPALINRLAETQTRWEDELRRPTSSERDDRVRHAVSPLLAAVVK